MRYLKYYFLVGAVTTIIVLMCFEMTIFTPTYNPRSRQILQSDIAEDYHNAEPRLPQVATSKIDKLDNIPNIYLEDAPKFPQGHNKTCAPYPQALDLQFTNELWQTQQTSNGTFHLLNAYFDDRPQPKSIRIIVLYDRIEPTLPTYCQLWFNDTTMKIVKPPPYFYIWHKAWGGQKNGIFQPYLVTCPLPDNSSIPISVSLVEFPCGKATNSLKVKYDKHESKKNFVVCVKGLNFPYDDKTLRLVEWIEVLNVLGAEKINFYDFSIHPNVRKMLNYYEDKGLVEVTPLTLAGPYSNDPYFQTLFLHKKLTERRLQEVIPYNDCLYKHLNEFRYVVLLDIDEVIVPTNNTWLELLAVLEVGLKGKTGGYAAQNVYFLDSHQHDHEWFNDIPKYMHMLQHVYRARNYTKPGSFIKCFHDTDQVMALHNHFPKMCIMGPCSARPIDVSLAHLQHYRSDCVREIKNCAEMKADSIMDARLWKFKDDLIQRVQRTLGDLGFLEYR